MLIQALVAEPAVEAFDVGVLDWFPRLNEEQFDVVIGTLYATGIVKLSRVQLSITVKERNRRPDARPSLTKSMLHV